MKNPSKTALLQDVRASADYAQIVDAGCRAAALIECRRERIREIMVEIATFDSIETEIEDAIRLLRTAGVEFPAYRRSDPDTQLRVFLPANNLLYSLALFVLLPSLYLDNVLARPASRVQSLYLQLAQLLSDGPIDIAARLRTYSQQSFIDVSQGSVVVFNGRPDNGRTVHAECASGLFLGFGAGINPIVVGPDLAGPELHTAVDATLRARLYNNGQDCLCPDVVFVDAAVAADFATELIRRLRRIPVVSSGAHPGLISSPLADTETYDRAVAAVTALDATVVWSGKASAHPRHCPTVVSVRRIDEGPAHAPELFGPIFNVVVYDRFDEVASFLTAPGNAELGMYVSAFGVAELVGVERLGTARNTGSRTAFQFESGHEPFGGFGVDGTLLAGAGLTPTGKPLLLSAELARRSSGYGAAHAR
ncbi:aldehyde dehydrogenase family protein [Nocardia sp. CDC159]|uniref:Aldehyde dehydrogenase family protein n=1 Tax=Nocardia pulmonis TaxID=2951408 RepID=A0A9X2E537_9NOCA|nr:MULTISPECIES: aldehyde dehydrogenase family protein [Nocardia]MCM6773959.1 aldehyde dehydrogenase family protein [Nocardia pulmonis]MCM6786846.1 aldehyde dehydrogenase family protein [Nocardia sp. CDC159]